MPLLLTLVPFIKHSVVKPIIDVRHDKFKLLKHIFRAACQLVWFLHQEWDPAFRYAYKQELLYANVYICMSFWFRL